MADTYDIDVDVSIEGDENDLRTHRTLRIHVGLDNHLNEDVNDSNNSEIYTIGSNNSNGFDENKEHIDSRKAAYASYTSLNNNYSSNEKPIP
jgi:hypothetical protein